MVQQGVCPRGKRCYGTIGTALYGSERSKLPTATFLARPCKLRNISTSRGLSWGSGVQRKLHFVHALPKLNS